MKRRTALLVVGGFSTALAVGPGVGARADAPAQQGWWTSASPASAPAPLPVSAPATLPVNPAGADVPSNGLLVQGGSGSAAGPGDASPTSFAGVEYQLAQGSTVTTLTLTAAGNTATNPNTTLQVCPIKDGSTFNAEEGGPMSDAPTFDCTQNASATASNGTYQFNVASLQSASGALNLAILPTSPSDRVVLNQPDNNSLAVQAPPDTTTPDTSSVTDGSAAATTPDSSVPLSAPPVPASAFTGAASSTPAASGPVDNSGSGVTPVITPSVASSPAVTTPTATGSASAPSNQNQQVASAPSQLASTTTSGGTHPIAVILLVVGLLLAGGLWMAAGRSGRAAAPE